MTLQYYDKMIKTASRELGEQG